jgi:hypothetical protein
MMSFDAVMAVYASAGGQGKVTLPQSFDDSIIEGFREKARKR